MEDTSGKQRVVLIVDDHQDLLRFFWESLTILSDLRVETAENGIDGLERCIELQPDCMVIDVKMPGLNGYELVRVLRGDPLTAGIPLVILTAMAQEKDQFIGLASGADQYLLKPITADALLAAIEKAILVGDSERRQSMFKLLEESPFDGKPATIPAPE
jgi:two-component system alkaline phosphatase synthesis response regulator PhoP